MKYQTKGYINMPTYVSLMKLTDQGVKEIKDAPKRVKESVKSLEALGGKLVRDHGRI
jgi:uncharacterized protein with GYD domain